MILFLLSFRTSHKLDLKNVIFVIRYLVIMTTNQLEKKILRNTKGLSQDSLQEILDFVRFIRAKKLKSSPDDLSAELSLMDSSETAHLEEEFTDYKKRYPNE